MRRFALLAGLTALVATIVVSSAAALGFTPESLNPPVGVVGQPYLHNIAPQGGCGPYEYRIIQGSLPDGLKLAADEGRIDGTPTKAGSWNFWAEIESCLGNTTQRNITINIQQGLSITTTSLPVGTVSAAYSAQLKLNEPNAAVAWSVTGGALPGGLTLAANNGTIAGTPTAAGKFTVSVQAKETGGSVRVAKGQFTIDVAMPVTLTATAGPAEVSKAYTVTPVAAGGVAPYAFSLTAGALPPGLTLDAATGVLSGVPTAAGSFALTLTVADPAGRTAAANLTIQVAAKLKLKAQKLKAGKVGSKYRARIAYTGGSGKVTFFVIKGRIPGLTLGKGGLLAGKPKRAGSYKMTVEVVDALGVRSRGVVTLKVLA